jgi:hypothetical protein
MTEIELVYYEGLGIGIIWGKMLGHNTHWKHLLVIRFVSIIVF